MEPKKPKERQNNQKNSKKPNGTPKDQGTKKLATLIEHTPFPLGFFRFFRVSLIIIST